jgi:PAS domain S-box-containing protein
MQQMLITEPAERPSTGSVCADENRRILVIDDNESIHADYRKILTCDNGDVDSDFQDLSAALFGSPTTASEEEDFDVHSALQGEIGCNMVRKSLEELRPYAMAFVDMRMPPGWDGLETMEHLWEVDPDLQIVICTAYSDNSWKEINDRVKHRDRLLILKKPFDSVEVRQLAIALTLKWNLERQAKQKMRAIVETARDGIITFDAEGDICCCNRASCKIFGYASEELAGCHVAVLLAQPERLTGGQFPLNNVETNQKEPLAQEVEGRRADGSTVPLLVSVTSFAGKSGPMYAMILRDLSEYKQLQRELSNARKLESFGRLAIGIADEIHDPMQGVNDNLEYLKSSCENLLDVVAAFEENLAQSGPPVPWDGRIQFAEALKSEHDFERLRRHLRPAIDESLEGVRDVIDVVYAMKEFSYLGPAEKEPADINKAVQSSVTLARNRWKTVADLRLELDPNLPSVNCRLAEINNVLLNLVLNASDAIAEKVGLDGSVKGRITIRTRFVAEAVAVDIEDTGCGIPTEILPHIFEPQFSTKQSDKGSGQGLAIAYDIVVNKHQGRLDVQSTGGEGTKFVVQLPCG